MTPDLVGYVLNALDPPSRDAVDEFLRDNPAAQLQVDTLRQSLEPLSWDPNPATPPNLADRTIRYVEASQPAGAGIGIRGLSMRRLLEAAAVLLIVGTAAGIGMSWLGGLRSQIPGSDPSPVLVAECKENLHKVFVALSSYGDTHHGQFPSVAEQPAHGGGMVFAVLHDSDLLPSDFKLTCPSTACAVPLAVGIDDIKAMNPVMLQNWNKNMQNGYAYSIGYSNGGQLVSPRLESGKPNSQLPLIADSSPADPLSKNQSPNHGGCGQNVLYYDGHVAFCPTRNVGYNLDDIFLNRANRVAAGVDWSDAVLTSTTIPE